MKNGIYACREIRIRLYEKGDAEPFVEVINNKCPDYPIILSGDAAKQLIHVFANCLDIIDKEKGS